MWGIINHESFFSLYHIFKHWKHEDHYLYRYAMVVFLYAIVNGIVSFILPVFLEESISSLALVGFILASSSVWNIVTDLVLGFTRRTPSYRSLTTLVGMIVFALFGMVWLHNHPVTLIAATVLWGIYTELFAFANFDFLIHASSPEERATHAGVLTNFRSLGFALAPIMIGVSLAEHPAMALVTGLFFSVCMLVLFRIQVFTQKLPQPVDHSQKRRNVLHELHVWRDIGKKMSHYLAVYFVRGVADGALTSFVPIFVEMKSSLKLFGGFIVAGLSLPTAFLSGYLGMVADKLGHKMFILVGMLMSALGLFGFGFAENPYLSLLLSLAIGLGYALYVPPLEAELSLYVERHHAQEAEVGSESGVFYNVGFIIGAAGTGVLVGVLGGYGPTFALLGLLYALIGLWFWVKK